MRRKTYKSLLLLTSVCITYTVCWLPFNIYNTLIAFGTVDYNERLPLFLNLIAMCSATINPIMYGMFNRAINISCRILVKQCVLIVTCQPPLSRRDVLRLKMVCPVWSAH